MSEQEYQMLRNRSKKADMSMNRYLLTQLQAHPPLCYRKEGMEKLMDDLNHSGQIINEIAKSFNSGCGSEAQLQEWWRATAIRSSPGSCCAGNGVSRCGIKSSPQAWAGA